jgi:hypothetical protein
VPALLLYPSINFLSERGARRLITTQYSVEAQNHVQRLQELTLEARNEIDRDPRLPGLVSEAADQVGPAARSYGAFAIWQRTALNRERLTSAVELYNRSGDLVSRFGLNFPEYTGSAQKPQRSPSCQWEMFGELQPFGSEERNMLHSERSIATGPEPSSADRPARDARLSKSPVHQLAEPYFELFRPTESRAPGEARPAAMWTCHLRLGPSSDLHLGPHRLVDQRRLFQRIYDTARTPFGPASPAATASIRCISRTTVSSSARSAIPR